MQRLCGSARSAVTALILAGLCACGHKAPPLPPFSRVPSAPADVKVARRADAVELQFTVPSTNTDGTRPANIERVDVYGFAGPDIKDEELVKHERDLRLTSVAVKAPRDPNATVEPDESMADLDPLEGVGLDQGAVAHVRQALTAASLVPPVIKKKPVKQPPVVENAFGPLLGPPATVPSFTLVAFGVSTHGRPGPMSSRVRVPLVPPPPRPSTPTVCYDETTITVSWFPPDGPPPQQERQEGQEEVLVALKTRPTWYPPPTIGYHVYEVPSPAATLAGRVNAAESAAPPVAASAVTAPPVVAPPATAPPVAPGAAGTAEKPDAKRLETRLTESPIATAEYLDHRMAWGTERCYAVRTVATIAGQSIESDQSPPTCEKLADTFPPAPPKGLRAVGGEGVINLIWLPNAERDLAGYILLRGKSADTLEPITAALQETTFRDGVPAGTHFYAVKAIDKAGNLSEASPVGDAMAR